MRRAEQLMAEYHRWQEIIERVVKSYSVPYGHAGDLLLHNANICVTVGERSLLTLQPFTESDKPRPQKFRKPIFGV